MAFGNSDAASGTVNAMAVKVLIAGGFGVGKTTLVGTVSEIAPLRTEEVLTERGAKVDDLTGVEAKSTTTVAMDFGKLTINDDLILYVFGTPGQERFWFMWDELAAGALGAVVLADTRRLDACFPSVDFFEQRGLPFVLAVNRFDGAEEYDDAELRDALDLAPHIPVLFCDAREKSSAKIVLESLIQHLLDRVAMASAG